MLQRGLSVAECGTKLASKLRGIDSASGPRRPVGCQESLKVGIADADPSGAHPHRGKLSAINPSYGPFAD